MSSTSDRLVCTDPDRGDNDRLNRPCPTVSRFSPDTIALDAMLEADVKGFSDRMHERNILRWEQPNFSIISLSEPALQPFLMDSSDGRRSINWKSDDAIKALTRALYHHYFGLTLLLPKSRLCPVISLRVNYIHWIASDLLHQPIVCGAYRERLRRSGAPDPTVHDEDSDKTSPSRLDGGGRGPESEVWGIDIGTGATCVFPLLGRKLYGWKFLATDIDAESLEYARSNLLLNPGVGPGIILKYVADAEKILEGVVEADKVFDFCMCNPPFFASLKEKGRNRHRRCIATNHELVTRGGEERFVTQLVYESLTLTSQRVRWFSSMMGKKSTFYSIRRLLKSLHPEKVECWKSTTLYQGRSARWVLGWRVRSQEIDLSRPSTEGNS